MLEGQSPSGAEHSRQVRDRAGVEHFSGSFTTAVWLVVRQTTHSVSHNGHGIQNKTRRQTQISSRKSVKIIQL